MPPAPFDDAAPGYWQMMVCGRDDCQRTTSYPRGQVASAVTKHSVASRQYGSSRAERPSSVVTAFGTGVPQAAAQESASQASQDLKARSRRCKDVRLRLL